MFKKLFDKYCSEARVLIRLLIFCVIFASINAFSNKLKLQDCIIQLLFGISLYSVFLSLFDKKLTSRAETLAFTISLVSVLALLILVCVMGWRHS